MYGYRGYDGREYGYAKPPRATKSNVEQFIVNYLGLNLDNVKVVPVAEKPAVWKHACTQIGVGVLQPMTLDFYGVVKLVYVYCHMCGKVIYYVEE